MPKILLVEDEEKLARVVELELRYEGYEVEKAFDGREGLEKALSGDFDLVLLDIMLPSLSGMEVLRRLRRESQVLTVNRGSGKQEVVVTQRMYPVYQGAVVVCQGAGNSQERLTVIDAVSVLTGLSSDKISVVKWTN